MHYALNIDNQLISFSAVSKPTSSPIQAFKGAASTTGSSMAIAGLAAFAAIFLA